MANRVKANRSGSPTMHAVAARAGVSTATVSKVVNRIRTGVSEATRKKVEVAIGELGYRPNRSGRSLRTSRHSTIGLAIVDPSPRFLADPFTTNLVAGLSNYLSSRGFGLLLHGVLPGQLKSSFLIRESEIDGLCINLSGTRRARIAAMRMVAETGQPLVVFQDRPVRGLQDACFIRQDDEAGAAELARELLRRKRRRTVMIITDVPWPAVEHRVAGIRNVFQRHGVSVDMVACDETRTEAITQAIATYLDREEIPDLIIGQNDQIAIAAIEVLRNRGLKVPDNVGVSGFNAFPFTGLASPALTTVRSRAYELGEAGGAVMLERLETGSFQKSDHVFSLDLMIGESA
ncbi:MAG: LacI family DNA-binding transcriptional regulator [Acetobacterales bacterium]